jgi:hypothetical protein
METSRDSTSTVVIYISAKNLLPSTLAGNLSIYRHLSEPLFSAGLASAL